MPRKLTCTKFKATEQFLPSMAELIMLYKMVLTFESVEEILQHFHVELFVILYVGR